MQLTSFMLHYTPESAISGHFIQQDVREGECKRAHTELLLTVVILPGTERCGPPTAAGINI